MEIYKVLSAFMGALFTIVLIPYLLIAIYFIVGSIYLELKKEI